MITLAHFRANPGDEKMFHFEGNKTNTLKETCGKPVGRQNKSSEGWEQV